MIRLKVSVESDVFYRVFGLVFQTSQVVTSCYGQDETWTAMAEGAQGASCEAERLRWIWSANSNSKGELRTAGEHEIHMRCISMCMSSTNNVFYIIFT